MRFASTELVTSHRNGSQLILGSEKVDKYRRGQLVLEHSNQPLEVTQQSAFRRPGKEEKEGEREVRLLFFRPPALKLWRFLW